jgi:hypothetical protein
MVRASIAVLDLDIRLGVKAVDSDPPGLVFKALHLYPELSRRTIIAQPLPPFNYHRGLGGQRLVEAERGNLSRILDTVKVDVVERATAPVFMDKSECRAGHVLFAGHTQSGSDTFYQRGLARAEFALQEHQAGWRKMRGQFTPEGDGFFGRMSKQVTKWLFHLAMS